MSEPVNNDAGLVSVIDALSSETWRFGFFAAVRAVERAAADMPRIGRALAPVQEPIALAHHATADFPRTTVERLDTRTDKPGRRPRLRSNHLGLTGAMGPMPFYLTELVIYERERRGPKPLGDFLDLLSQRLLQFHYRAWADSQPCAQADRPADDGFAAQLGGVSGAADLRFVAGDSRPAHEAGRFDAWAPLGLAGHFAGLRSASAVADVLSTVLATPVRVVESVGRWRDIPPATRSCIGRRGNDNQLGLGATLGRRFFATEWDVRLVLAARSMDDLVELLPGGDRHVVLSDCARAILPRHIEWSARIEIDEAAIAPARLARGRQGARLGARLGQTAWIAPRGTAGRKRDDLRLHGAA